MSSVLLSKYFCLTSSLSNLEGGVRIDEKRVFFRKVFGHYFLGSANIIKRTLQCHNRQSGDTFKTFGGSLEFIPLKEYATQIPKSEIEKYISPIFIVFLFRLLRNFQNQVNSYSTSILTYCQLSVGLPTGNEIVK